MQTTYRNLTAHTLVLLIFLSCFYLLPLGRAPFSSQGEAREALVVKNMLEQNNYILPLRNGVEIPSKPPFFHWLSAVSVTLLRDLNEFSVRLPAAVASIVILLTLFVFFTILSTPKQGWFSVLLLATTSEWARTSSLSRVDMVFTLFLVGTFVVFFLALEEHREGRSIPKKAILFLVALFVGATLSKGPTGIIIPLVISGSYTLWLRFKGVLKEIPWSLFIFPAIFSCLLSASWYYAAYLQGGKEFLEVQLVKENAARALGMKGYEIGHEKPWYYSVIYLIISFLPWSLLLPILLPNLWQKRKELFSETLVLYCFYWIGFFFLIVTFASSKRGVYYLPAFPALAFIFIRSTTIESKRTVEYKFVSAILFTLGTVLLSLGCFKAGYIFWGEEMLHTMFVKPSTFFQVKTILDGGMFGYLFPITGGVLLLSSGVWCLRRDIEKVLQTILAASFVVFFSINQYFFPLLAAANSPKIFMEKVSELVPEEAPLYLYGETNYPAMFYAKKNLLFSSRPEELMNIECFVIAQKKDVENLTTVAAAVYESNSYAHYGKDKLVLLKCH